MKNYVYVLIVFLYSFILESCSKEYSRSISQSNWAIQDQMTTKANFQGFIFDVNNQPLSGAFVNAGDRSTATNEEGVFFIDQASVSAYNAVVTITKPGYFTCVKSLRLSAGDDNVIKVQLVEKKLSGAFAAKDGGTVSLESGTSVSIPANGLVDGLSSQPYTGNVKVYMHWMDPSNVNILNQMPGELRGINTSGDERMIITYGMTTVELEGEEGQKLQLAKGTEAKLTFEVPTNMEIQAPLNIPLWYYDEKNGRWFEEGMAKLIDGKYEGQVKHFTTWNCDAPYDQPMIKFCLKVKDEYDVPYANAHILVRRANDRWGGHGYTNGQGLLCGLIPANTPLILEILGEAGCEQTVLSKPIGPYKEDIELDSVVVKRNPEKMITVTGSVIDCNGKPVKEGYVQGKISYRAYIGKVIDGKFEFTVGRCPSDNELTIFAVDNDTKKLTDRITQKFNGNKANIGTLTACVDISKSILNGLIGYYPFNGNANDESGNNLNGSVTGATLSTDRKGAASSAYSFANGQYISIPGTENKNLYPLTISLWYNSSVVPTNSFGTLFNKYENASWNGFEINVADYRNVSNNGQTLNNGFGTASHYLKNGQSRIIGYYGEPEFLQQNIQFGTWYYYTFVVDEVGAKIYVDGVLKDSHNWTGTAGPCTTSSLWKIGGTRTGSMTWFNGKIDDVRVYDRALTPAEIEYLFKQ
ncbi:MAG: LamG-like jellyroll fold domain-containing protein [Chitinophagaceae bacterium]